MITNTIKKLVLCFCLLSAVLCLKAFAEITTDTLADRSKRINENIGRGHSDISASAEMLKETIKQRSAAMKAAAGESLKETIKQRQINTNNAFKNQKDSFSASVAQDNGEKLGEKDEKTEDNNKIDANPEGNSLSNPSNEALDETIEQENNGPKEKKEYFKDGNIKSIKTYENKKLNGEARFYDDKTGRLKSIYVYSNNKLNGLGKIFYEDGHTIKGEVPYKNNKLEGKGTIYFPNGKIQSQTTFKNDKPNGESSTYDINEKLLYKEIYKGGTRIKRQKY